MKRFLAIGSLVLGTVAAGCSESSETDELGEASEALSCAILPQWQAQTYAAGAQVQNQGQAYECKPWPYSTWCGQYEPGVAWAWQDAWTLLGACDSAGSTCTTDRNATDRPDDQQDLYQVRVWYVLPQDGVDKNRDTDGSIRTSVESFTKWMKNKVGGRSFRVDRCGGAIDIGFLRLSKTNAELNTGDTLHNIGACMAEASVLSNNKKMNLVYYEGTNGTCASANVPSVPGQYSLAAIYLNTTFSDPSIPACNTHPLGASLDNPGYLEFSMLHEVFHLNGAVPSCAPHASNTHVSDFNTDLMYAGAQAWSPQTIDVNNDDYFGTGSTSCWDVARSAFIDPLPVNASPPTNW